MVSSFVPFSYLIAAMTKPTNVILSIAAFPPAVWFAYYLQSENCLIEKHEHFQKQSYRNRYIIATANGKNQLSIPVKHDNQKDRRIADIEISVHDHWQRLHWRSLITAYNNAPYFEYYEPYLKPLFKQAYAPRLFDFNMTALDVCLKLMKIKRMPLFTAGFLTEYDKNVDDLRYIIHPKKTIAYALPEYRQVFTERQGFLPDLSILDVLFNLGPESVDYLMSIKLSADKLF